MSKTNRKAGDTTRSKTSFTLKKVQPGLIAAVVLENLSRVYGDCCNYLEAASLARQGELFMALASIEQHNASRTVVSARACWVQAQALSVVKKLVDPEVDRWASTKAQWFRTENRCRRLNQKFAALANRKSRGGTHPFDTEIARFREAIHFVLGDAPDLNEVAELAHYGPGSTVEIRGRAVHYQRKLTANECVPSAISLAVQALSYDKAVWAHVGMDPVYYHNPDAWEGFTRVTRELLQANVVMTDNLMFIHKNMTSLRSIGAQPTVSGMLQLGVHSYMVPLLAAVGVDLTNQGWNQRLAREGSLRWRDWDAFCTLDKTDASNRLCQALVSFHFPPKWSHLLMSIRTPGYIAPPELGGGQHGYHMYAGMGNGTTFVVESLVFWAASFATSDYDTVENYARSKQFAVYGDDVILRRPHAIRYMRFARFLGFQFNDKKTFLDGPFRESCGADYYGGVPVRPATLDEEGDTISLLNLVGFHNTLADNVLFPLDDACGEIRRLAKARLYPVTPTDWSGNLGFRPRGCAQYDIVRDSSGKPLLSTAWQRPRVYRLEVKPQFGDLGTLDHWTQMAVALLRARQTSESPDGWALPLRERAATVKVVPERDLVRKDLVQMLTNQLARIRIQKGTPWWADAHPGCGRDKG